MSGDNTIKIFVASSAEVKEEREKCVLLINQLNKSHKHLNLETVEWEYDVVGGSFYEYEDIQGDINLKLKECQLAIFIFYSKVGKYTHQEFEFFKAERKKLFTLFKQGFSPKNKEQNSAYGELLEFKAGLNDIVLYKDYNNIDEFEKHLYNQVNLYFSETYTASPAANFSELAVQLSDSVATLVRLLAEKEEEIRKLKQKDSSLPALVKQRELKQSLEGKNPLKQDLLQNNSTPKIYFSYAWRDKENEDREKFVTELYNSFKQKATDKYIVVRDKEDLGYKGSISEFMKEIGRGDIVVVAISDKYLKSEYCMYELHELYLNSNSDLNELLKKFFLYG